VIFFGLSKRKKMVNGTVFIDPTPGTLAPAQASYTTLAVTVIGALISFVVAVILAVMKSGAIAGFAHRQGKRVPYLNKVYPFRPNDAPEVPQTIVNTKSQDHLQQIITNTINVNLAKSLSEIKAVVEEAVVSPRGSQNSLGKPEDPPPTPPLNLRHPCSP